MILFITVLIFYIRMIFHPMNRLVLGMRQVEAGNLDVHIEPDSNDEFGFITDTFNNMVQRVKELMDQIIKYQESTRQAEIAALEARFNPHFLYNTLDIIYWALVVNNRPSEADMVIKLSDMLRYSILSSTDFVLLDEDIKQLDNYLSLQKYHLQNKLNYTVSMGQGASGVKVPKLILQPIVENALKHGFKDIDYPGVLEIAAETHGGKLTLSVRDNGVGIPPEKIPALFESGIGLKITRDRLRFVYGKEYDIRVNSLPLKGTTITITIAQSPLLS